MSLAATLRQAISRACVCDDDDDHYQESIRQVSTYAVNVNARNVGENATFSTTPDRSQTLILVLPNRLCRSSTAHLDLTSICASQRAHIVTLNPIECTKHTWVHGYLAHHLPHRLRSVCIRRRVLFKGREELVADPASSPIRRRRFLRSHGCRPHELRCRHCSWLQHRFGQRPFSRARLVTYFGKDRLGDADIVHK